MNRLKNFKVGDYLYCWRAQGYVKIINDLSYKDDLGNIHPIAVVSLKPFFPNEVWIIDINGRVLYDCPYGNSKYVIASPTFMLFDDLDTYYEFVKRTTNTPVVVKKMRLSGIEPGDIIIVRTPGSNRKKKYTVYTVAEDHNYITVREGTLAFNMNGGSLYRKHSCYISAYRKKGSNEEIEVNDV